MTIPERWPREETCRGISPPQISAGDRYRFAPDGRVPAGGERCRINHREVSLAESKRQSGSSIGDRTSDRRRISTAVAREKNTGRLVDREVARALERDQVRAVWHHASRRTLRSERRYPRRADSRAHRVQRTRSPWRARVSAAARGIGCAAPTSPKGMRGRPADCPAPGSRTR